MGAVSVDDIIITSLSRIPTAGGDVMHAIKSGEPSFAGFGEAYFSWVAHGAVKAWKKHIRMTMNVVVPIGTVRFVFCAEGVKEFRVEDIGDDRYARITVPPGIWFGFQGKADPKSLVLNVANILHDPTEADRRGVSDFEYVWS